MADMKENLSWEKLGNAAQSQRDEFQIVYDYPDKEIIAPFVGHEYTDDMMITLIDQKGSSVMVPLHERSENIPGTFSWARESLEKTAAEWDKINSGEEKPLLDNFRQRGGILNLTQGNADSRKLFNSIEKTHAETFDDVYQETLVLGAALQEPDGSPIKDNIDFIVSLSAEHKTTTLLHELTHEADHGISDSDLFKGCYTLDMARGSKIVKDLLSTMQEFIEKGGYSPDKINKEMICRLNEERHAKPEQFKKECPLLDAFYAKVFYPALSAQTAAVHQHERIGNQSAFSVLHDNKLLSDKISPLSAQDEGEISEIYRAFSSASGDRRKDIESVLHSKIDNSTIVQNLQQSMDDFQKRMQGLKQETIASHIVEKRKTTRKMPWGMVCGPDGKNYQVPLDKKGKMVIPESLKPKTSVSNHDLLKASAHSASATPDNSLNSENQQKNTDNKTQANPNILAAKKGYSM